MKQLYNQTEILPVTEEHLPVLVDLAGVIWRQHYPGIISHVQIEYMLGKMYAPDKLRDEIRSQGIHFYRLVVDGQMAGFASIGPLEISEVWKLHKLYLLPGLHGSGLGTLLLKHCETEACRFGAKRLQLAVNQRNFRPIATYKRNGFVVIGSVLTDFGGGFVMDDFIMAKDLKVSKPR